MVEQVLRRPTLRWWEILVHIFVILEWVYFTMICLEFLWQIDRKHLLEEVNELFVMNTVLTSEILEYLVLLTILLVLAALYISHELVQDFILLVH